MPKSHLIGFSRSANGECSRFMSAMIRPVCGASKAQLLIPGHIATLRFIFAF